MYTRPVIYKVFSIIMLVAGALVLAGGIIAFASPGFTDTLTAVFKEMTADADTADGLANATKIGIFVCSIIVSVLTYFLEFVFFASFSRFANHMKIKDNTPLPQNTTLISTSLMKVLGIIVFVVNAAPFVFGIVVFVIAMIYSLIAGGLAGFLFGLLIVLMIALYGLLVALYYIHYIVRFRAFDAVVSIAKKSNASEEDKRRLAKINSNIPRGMCSFLYGFSIAFFILPAAILMFLIFIKAESAAGQYLAKWYIWLPSNIVVVLLLSIYGCMYDNLAMGMEHEMIKYRLFDKNK